MSNYFPQNTSTMRTEQPTVFRRLSLSLVEMALITGLLVRVYRSLVLTHGSSSLFYIGSTVTVGLLFIIGMTTAHLSNYPLHHWVWRAPAFAGLEVVGEMATSLFLVWVSREPNGTVRAHYGDWPSMAIWTLVLRALVIVVWSLILAGIVQLVRRGRLVKEEADDPVTAD